VSALSLALICAKRRV